MSAPLVLFFGNWMNLGTMQNGLSQTLSITYRKTGKGSLSSVLEENVDEKYYLSAEALETINERVERSKQEATGWQLGICNEMATALDSNYFKGHDGKRPFVKDPRIRRLTPRECERLQGFPDDWTAGLSDTQRYKAMGNAVSVSVIEAIGKKILKTFLK